VAARRARAPGPKGAFCVLCVSVCRVDMVVRRHDMSFPAVTLRVLVACPPARLPVAVSSRG